MTKSIEACIEEAVERGAVSKTCGKSALDELGELRDDRGLLIANNHKLRERVDYLESAITTGGAAYRAARAGLGAPDVERDDYFALKERAERAEQALTDEQDAHTQTRERAEKAEAELDRIRAERWPHTLPARGLLAVMRRRDEKTEAVRIARDVARLLSESLRAIVSDNYREERIRAEERSRVLASVADDIRGITRHGDETFERLATMYAAGRMPGDEQEKVSR